MPFTVTLDHSGRQFVVNADESVLDGAARAGVALPWRCRYGDCGSCRATLLEGSCAPIYEDAGDDVDSREVLLCRVRATSDLRIAAREVVAVEDIPCQHFEFEVADTSLLAPQVMDLTLKPAGGEPMRWLPGQYLEVILDDGRRRAFSIANAPNAEGIVHLHVRNVAGGGFTSFVFEHLRPGMRLSAEGPLGTFVPHEASNRSMIFVAGGTGFAPIKAIVEHFLALGSTRPMHLYWGARSSDELYLRDEVEGWTAQSPWLQFHGVISGDGSADGLRRGLVHEAVLADHPHLGAHEVYLCGPPAMVDAGRHAFVDAGLPDHRLYFDSYEYAPDLLAAILAQRAGIDGR
jgi:CDP-4-dehydro-6-deoxyglucose reductase